MLYDMHTCCFLHNDKQENITVVKVIGSLDRGLHILDLLGSTPRPLGVTEIAGVLRVDKSTAYRLLCTLQNRGYVEQLETKKYRLGLRCVHLGAVTLDAIDTRAEAAPFMEELARRTGKTVHLAILAGEEAIIADKVQGHSIISISTSVGSEAPLHSTASGKAILASLPLERVHEFCAGRELVRFTPNTITDPAILEDHLKTVRKQGYAVDDEERYEGVRCVAAPFFDHTGLVGSIGISAASSQMNTDQLEDTKVVVMDVASRLSHKLGHLVTE
jgi:IclR family acetate operon transcriptional repressor